MRGDDRAGFVRFQQELAREALTRGHIGAARLALRYLRPHDFVDREEVTAECLAVLRSSSSSENQVVRAVVALIRMRPADEGVD
jgi:hypothetical protein